LEIVVGFWVQGAYSEIVLCDRVRLDLPFELLLEGWLSGETFF
jgi:hypothetical protein